MGIVSNIYIAYGILFVTPTEEKTEEFSEFLDSQKEIEEIYTDIGNFSFLVLSKTIRSFCNPSEYTAEELPELFKLEDNLTFFCEPDEIERENFIQKIEMIKERFSLQFVSEAGIRPFVSNL